MSEQIIDPAELLLCYNKYKAIISRQKICNKNYRLTDVGKQKQYLVHRAWVIKKKDDVEYQKLQNTNAKARYQIRKAKKLALEEKLALDEKDKSLGKTENTENIQKIDLV